MVIDTTRATSMMKNFLAPPRPPNFVPGSAWTGSPWLDLTWGVRDNVGAKADSELSAVELGLHQSDPKFLELFPSGNV